MGTAWSKRYWLWVLVGILAFGLSLAGGYLAATKLEDGRQIQEAGSVPTQIEDNNESDVLVGTGTRTRDVQVGECEFWQETRNEWTVAGTVNDVNQEGEWYKMSLSSCENDGQFEVWVPADIPSVQWGYATEDGLVWENLTPAELVTFLTEGKMVAVTVPIFADEAEWREAKFGVWSLSKEDCVEMAICRGYLEYLDQQAKQVSELHAKLQAGEAGFYAQESSLYSTEFFSLNDWDELVRLKTEGGL